MSVSAGTKLALVLSARDMARKERNLYGKNGSKKLPSFGSIDEVVRFFETHDMGDYAEQMPEAKFDVAIKRRKYLVAIDGKLMSKLTEIAKSKKLPAEKLIKSWLEEKLLEPDL